MKLIIIHSTSSHALLQNHVERMAKGTGFIRMDFYHQHIYITYRFLFSVLFAKSLVNVQTIVIVCWWVCFDLAQDRDTWMIQWFMCSSWKVGHLHSVERVQ
jgi:hypothetical protein